MPLHGSSKLHPACSKPTPCDGYVNRRYIANDFANDIALGLAGALFGAAMLEALTVNVYFHALFRYVEIGEKLSMAFVRLGRGWARELVLLRCCSCINAAPASCAVVD
jgi:hypothetical protein